MYMQYQINGEMLQLARRQFCLDVGLDWQQYLAEPGKRCYIQRTSYRLGTKYPQADGARCYHGTDAFFKAVMCMGQLFLAVDEQIYDWAVEKFSNYPPEWFCEYGNLRMIDEKLREYGRGIKDTHVYFLPREETLLKQQDIAASQGRQKDETDVQVQTEENEKASVSAEDSADKLIYQWYDREEILQFKENNRFTSAICFSPTQPDMLAVAALMDNSGNGKYYDGDKQWKRAETPDIESGLAEERNTAGQFDQSYMAGMAGVSADGEYLWQIGINVVPEYAGRGLGVKLVSQIKNEIIRRGKVPFYGTSESHTVSQSIAIKSGFVPAWTEIYVKSIEN